MAEVDFSDLESTKAWFEKQSIEARCTMTSRMALRVLANVSRADAKDVQALAIRSLRCTLTSAVRGLGRTADVDWLEVAALYAADSAARSADSAAYFGASSAADSATRSAESAAYFGASSAADSAADSADSAAYFGANSAANSAALWDSQPQGGAFIDLNNYKLWHGADVPEDVQYTHEDFLAYLDRDPHWQFFHDWYLAMWEGEWTDWTLATEVAKIADDVWEVGIEAVGAEIERIEATLKLKAEIASLKEKLQTHEAIATTGHNQGPPLDDTDEVGKTIELIWPIVEDLEAEVDSEAPSASRLKELGQQLLDVSIIIAKYCGGIADIAVKKSAETISETGTKWAIRAGVATYASSNEGIQSVAKAAWELAKVLGKNPAG